MEDSKEETSTKEVSKKKKMAMCKEFVKKHKEGIAVGIVAVLLIVLIGIGAYLYQKNTDQKNTEAVKASTEKFIKENLVAPGIDFKINSFVEEGGVYKMGVTVGEKNVGDSYVTKDGKKLFPQAIDLVKKDDAAAQAPTGPAPVTEVSQKTDVPVVELFVMSYCPYGTQMEKGILPVVKTLGAKIKFDIKFVSYVMHGENEFKENMNQYCIQKEEPTKYLGYLACFNKESDSTKCAVSSKISTAKISACVSAIDKQFNLTADFNTKVQDGSYPPFNIQKDLNEKYGVQGSPSLVINGQLVESGRDSASILKTVCSGFTNPPEECSTALSSAIPSPGFGDGTEAASGSAASGASCQ